MPAFRIKIFVTSVTLNEVLNNHGLIQKYIGNTQCVRRQQKNSDM